MDDSLALLFIFLLGAIVGSFLNVVGLRLRSGLTLGGRSACSACAKTLRWWELVPIISFFILRGRCSSCKARISWQYPVVELWTGLIFLSIYNLQFTILQKVLILAVFCLYVAITIYDLRHKIIPDSLVYASVALALAYRLYAGGTTLDWLIGPMLFAVLGLGWLLSKGRALGFGDAKLALSVGLLLGAAQGLSAMAMAFWIGTAVTLPIVFSGMLSGRKRLTIKSEIPFAPFIVLGAWASLLFGLDIFYVLSLTN